MITARMIGQFGNQLFTYVVCKILAERTGLAYSPPIEFVNKRGQPVVWSELPAIVMAPTAGRVLSERKLEGEHVQRICCDHWFDFSSLRSDHSPRLAIALVNRRISCLTATSSARWAEESTATTMQTIATATITPIGTTTLRRARSQWVYPGFSVARWRAAGGTGEVP